MSDERAIGSARRPPSSSTYAGRAMVSLRRMNEQTASRGGQMTDVYPTLSRLTHILRETAQAIEYAARWLEAEHEAGRIGTDDPIGYPVHAAVAALAAAAVNAAAAAPLLDEASAANYHLTRIYKTEDSVRHGDDSPPA